MKTYEFTIIIQEIDSDESDVVYSKCADASLEEVIESAFIDLRYIRVEPLHVGLEIPDVVLT